MSAAAGSGTARPRRRKARVEEHDEHIDERWLLTYADMITLLMALFIVLFSISSVNKSKYEVLQRTLSDAFSGKIFPGGQSIKEAGGSDATAESVGASPNAASLRPSEDGQDGDRARRARKEEQDFQRLKVAVDAAVRERGLGGKVRSTVSARGLEVRLLTDDLVFDSGSAVAKPQGVELLTDIGQVLRADRTHPVIVEGHTDDVPIATAQFPTNWELSAARATGVVRALAGSGLRRERLTAQGRADLDEIATNASAGGRSLNRRVEILLPRQVAAQARGRATTRGGSGGTDLGSSIRPDIPSIRPDATEASP